MLAISHKIDLRRIDISPRKQLGQRVMKKIYVRTYVERVA